MIPVVLLARLRHAVVDAIRSFAASRVFILRGCPRDLRGLRGRVVRSGGLRSLVYRCVESVSVLRCGGAQRVGGVWC